MIMIIIIIIIITTEQTNITTSLSSSSVYQSNMHTRNNIASHIKIPVSSLYATGYAMMWSRWRIDWPQQYLHAYNSYDDDDDDDSLLWW